MEHVIKILFSDTDYELEFIEGTLKSESENSKIEDGFLEINDIITCKFRCKTRTKLNLVK